jgi:hypothetical protein
VIHHPLTSGSEAADVERADPVTGVPNQLVLPANLASVIHPLISLGVVEDGGGSQADKDGMFESRDEARVLLMHFPRHQLPILVIDLNEGDLVKKVIRGRGKIDDLDWAVILELRKAL